MKNNKFIKTFGHGSSIMLILIEFLSKKNKDLNKSDDLLNIILSCQTMYHTCNIYFSRRRIMWTVVNEVTRRAITTFTNIKNLNQNNFKRISSILYDSNELIENKLLKFYNLKKLKFSDKFDQKLNEGYLHVI